MATTAILGGREVTIWRGFAGMLIPGLLGLDVESRWMTDRGQFDPDFRVRTVQFATEDTAWVFDLRDDLKRQQAIELLRDERNSFVSHTDMDVVSVWTEFAIDITHRNLDTRMLALQADPDRNTDADLKTLATKYGMPELAAADAELNAWMRQRWIDGGGKKNAKKSDVEEAGWNALADMPAEEWPEVFTRYAGLDAIAARRLAEILVPATQAPEKLLRTDQWLHVRATRQRLAGKRVDHEMLAAMLDEASQITGTAKSKAMDLTDGVNIGGPKIQPWLAEHGVDWDAWSGAWTDTGNPSLAKENVKLLYDFPLDDVGRQVVDEMVVFKGHQDIWNKCRDLTKRLVDHGPGGYRVHPLLNPIGASTTARMSSSGPNMQNMSKRDPRMRGLFLPDPGNVLVTIDFAQIELRVVAALAREPKMIDAILAGGDLHDLTVELLAELGVEITRDTAKMANFLIVYGGGGQALHDQSGIPLDIAYDVVKGMRAQYESINMLTQYLGMEKEAIRTISNRRLPVTRNKKTGDIRSYANVNYAVQSGAREVLVDAWIRLEEGHAGRTARPGIVWLPVHDELVLQVPEHEVDAVIADAEAAMRMDFRAVPVEADAIVLRDREGVSRWMTGKLAEKIAAEKVAA